MSPFTTPVQGLADVNLFGRLVGEHQYLVVSARYTCATDTSLILPIPVQPGCGDHEVRLLSLEGCTAFFSGLALGFQRTKMAERRGDDADDEQAPRTVRYTMTSPIRTTYVGSVTQFEHLPESQRLPPSVLAAAPTYGNFGFVVHQLPAGKNMRLVPLAVQFPTRDPSRVYLPTLQSHGGTVPGMVLMDYTLYLQHAMRLGLDETRDPAGDFMPVSATAGVVAEDHLVQRKVVYGSQPNADTWVDL